MYLGGWSRGMIFASQIFRSVALEIVCERSGVQFPFRPYVFFLVQINHGIFDIRQDIANYFWTLF